MLDEMRALSRQQAGERQHLHQQVCCSPVLDLVPSAVLRPLP